MVDTSTWMALEAEGRLMGERRYFMGWSPPTEASYGRGETGELGLGYLLFSIALTVAGWPVKMLLRC